MTKQDRQKLGILIVLLVVLGVTVVFGYRMNEPQTTSAVPQSGTKPSANPQAANDARILLDLVEKSKSGDDIGGRNLFQYRERPPAAASFGPRGGSPTPLSTAPAATNVPTPGPPTPQARPVPPIGLKYQGFAATNNPTRALTAFLSDDARHYNVTAGEILMGRYRIVNITDKSVEVEDLEYNRRQMLPLLKQ